MPTLPGLMVVQPVRMPTLARLASTRSLLSFMFSSRVLVNPQRSKWVQHDKSDSSDNAESRFAIEERMVKRCAEKRNSPNEYEQPRQLRDNHPNQSHVLNCTFSGQICQEVIS